MRCQRVEGYLVAAKLAIFIKKAARKKTALLQPGQKNPVAFPKRKVEQAAVLNPGQHPLGRVDQSAAELAGDKDKGIPVLVAAKTWKGEDAAQLRVTNCEPALFVHLADGAGFGRFARLKFAAQPVPLAQVHIVGTLDAVQHQRPSTMFKINQCRQFKHLSLLYAPCRRWTSWRLW